MKSFYIEKRFSDYLWRVAYKSSAYEGLNWEVDTRKGTPLWGVPCRFYTKSS